MAVNDCGAENGGRRLAWLQAAAQIAKLAPNVKTSITGPPDATEIAFTFGAHTQRTGHESLLRGRPFFVRHHIWPAGRPAGARTVRCWCNLCEPGSSSLRLLFRNGTPSPIAGSARPAPWRHGRLRPERISAIQVRYCAPLTVRVDPVMKPASSEARKMTHRAISAGSPRRPMGICAMIASRVFSGTAMTMSVAT